MSNRKAKTTPEKVEQAAPEATPETVEEQTVQAEAAPAEPAAQQGELPAAPAKPEEAPAAEVPPRPVIVVSAPQGLNLRKGPHVSYGVMTVLPDGAPVEILDLPLDVEVPGWALVEAGAGVGWVNTNFLREAEI